MLSLEPNYSLLRKFEAGMLLSAIGIPLIVASSHWCPGSLGLLPRTELFASFIRNNVATLDQVCLYENLLILFALYTIPGCWFLRKSYQQRALDLQMAKNKPINIKKAKMLVLYIFVFILFAIAVVGFIPDSAKLGHLDLAAEIKKFYGIMFMLCVDTIALGFSIAFWREAL
jgi:hypothetical protein